MKREVDFKLEQIERFLRRAYYPYHPSDINTVPYMSNVRPIYKALLSKKFIFAYREMRELKAAYGMNSYEQDMLVHRLDTESLLLYAKHLYRIGDIQYSATCPDTYSDAIVSRVAPLLIDRMRKMVRNMKNTREYLEKIDRNMNEIYRLVLGEEWKGLQND